MKLPETVDHHPRAYVHLFREWWSPVDRP